MKLKLYSILSVMMLVLAGCSSDDDDSVTPPEPVFRESYVSRIKVADINAPGSEAKTIKLYYDTQKRVTGIHWGTTVPGRSSCKLVYAADRVNIQKTGDAAGTSRYYLTDAEGRASELFYNAPDDSSRTSYVYRDNRIESIAKYFNHNAEPSVTSHFTWNNTDITRMLTHITSDAADTLTVQSDILYDEFAPNATNIDLNIILDAINGIIPEYEEIPMIIKKCGNSSARLVLRHTYSRTGAPTRTYNVVSYSLQQGRLADIETLDEANARHLKISIIYKSDSM